MKIVWAVLSLVLAVASVALTWLGFHTMYTYGDGTNDMTGHIVGGDAYNYIIIGIRGLGFVVAGAASLVGACIFAGVTILLARKTKVSNIPITIDSSEALNA